MEMSMRGSGIYSHEEWVTFQCKAEILDADDNQIGECDFDGRVLGWVDDWGNLTADCPKCGHENEIDY